MKREFQLYLLWHWYPCLPNPLQQGTVKRKRSLLKCQSPTIDQRLGDSIPECPAATAESQ